MDVYTTSSTTLLSVVFAVLLILEKIWILRGITRSDRVLLLRRAGTTLAFHRSSLLQQLSLSPLFPTTSLPPASEPPLHRRLSHGKAPHSLLRPAPERKEHREKARLGKSGQSYIDTAYSYSLSLSLPVSSPDTHTPSPKRPKPRLTRHAPLRTTQLIKSPPPI